MRIKDNEINIVSNLYGGLCLSYIDKKTNKRFKMIYHFYSEKQAIKVFKQHIKNKLGV